MTHERSESSLAEGGPGPDVGTTSDARSHQSTERVGVEHIVMSFGDQRVLNDVSLAIRPMELHALIGANGSGKSTLVKIVSGNYQPDAGHVYLGHEFRSSIRSPQQALSLGVRVVHQEAPLVDRMSVAECMALFRTYPVTSYGRVRWRDVRKQAKAELERFGVKIDIQAMAGTLTASERAYVALSVALGDTEANPVSLVVLDEVSASIPESEAEQFLRSIRGIALSGIPVLMVTHRLAEVERYADQMTILRDGEVVSQGPVKGMSRNEMISHITGGGGVTATQSEASSRLNSSVADRTVPVEANTGSDTPWLVVDRLTTARLSGVSFGVSAGEILGFVGGPESGVEDVPLALVGLVAASATAVSIGGVTQRLPRSPRQAMRAGISLVPRDRLHQGIVGSFSVEENVVLPRARDYWHKSKRARDAAINVINRFDVRPPDPRRLASVLSGGNQQKIIIGKWLNCGPRLMILDDPCTGVDPRAREQIFAIIDEAVSDGLCVILLSTEPEELAAHCTRVIGLSHGRVVGELSGKDVTYETISRWSVS